MDSNPTLQCRLCLEASGDFVNIFDSFQDSTIASVLSQHFWFQAYKNDGLSESLCEICWIHTKTFPNFYKRIESRHRYHRKSVSTVKKKSGDLDVETTFCTDLMKQERSGSPEETSFKPDFNLVKYEEPPLEVICSRTLYISIPALLSGPNRALIVLLRLFYDDKQYPLLICRGILFINLIGPVIKSNYQLKENLLKLQTNHKVNM